MHNHIEKERFLLNDYIPLIKSIAINQKSVWGKMNVQQMVEHMTDSIRIANEKNKADKIITPADRLENSYQFMMSDKLFKENTKNVLMADEPLPVRHFELEDSVLELENEIKDFYDFFNDGQNKKTTNPFFGYLNYEEWVHLFYKHSIHHLKQFSAI